MAVSRCCSMSRCAARHAAPKLGLRLRQRELERPPLLQPLARLVAQRRLESGAADRRRPAATPPLSTPSLVPCASHGTRSSHVRTERTHGLPGPVGIANPLRADELGRASPAGRKHAPSRPHGPRSPGSPPRRRACCCARPSSRSSSSSRWPSAIGANTAMFSVVNAVLLQALPFRDADRIVDLNEVEKRDRSRGAIAAPNFLDWRAQATSFDAMSVYAVRNMNVASAGGEPERLPGRLHLHVVLRRAGRPADPRPHVRAVRGRARARRTRWCSATGCGSGASAARRR